MRVVNLDSNAVVATSCRTARTFGTRLRGLIGAQPLQPGQGLVLEPCNSIHMFFMSFPIDAVYLDRYNRVLRVASNLQPWQLGPTVRHARRVLELPAGQAALSKIAEGHTLALNDLAFP
jgi:hypothetical protein